MMKKPVSSDIHNNEVATPMHMAVADEPMRTVCLAGRCPECTEIVLTNKSSGSIIHYSQIEGMPVPRHKPMQSCRFDRCVAQNVTVMPGNCTEASMKY